MSWKDQLEEKKQQAERLMKSLPGPTDVMWMFLNGSDLPEKESKELWDYIDSLKEAEE